MGGRFNAKAVIIWTIKQLFKGESELVPSWKVLCSCGKCLAVMESFLEKLFLLTLYGYSSDKKQIWYHCFDQSTWHYQDMDRWDNYSLSCLLIPLFWFKTKWIGSDWVTFESLLCDWVTRGGLAEYSTQVSTSAALKSTSSSWKNPKRVQQCRKKIDCDNDHNHNSAVDANNSEKCAPSDNCWKRKCALHVPAW